MLLEKMKLDVIDEVRFTLVTFLTNRVFCCQHVSVEMTCNDDYY